MKEIRLLLDCDPGLDDAVALALAMASPELVVTGISTVAANASRNVASSSRRLVRISRKAHRILCLSESRRHVWI